MESKKSCEFYLSGTGTVNTKGQIVIPKDARDRIGLQPGDSVTFLVKDTEALVVIPSQNADKLIKYIESEKKIKIISQK